MNFNWEAFKAGKMAVTGFKSEAQAAEFLQMCENEGLLGRGWDKHTARISWDQYREGTGYHCRLANGISFYDTQWYLEEGYDVVNFADIKPDPLETPDPTDTVTNPAIFPTTRQTILETAIQTVCEDRQDQYGSPEDNFGKIAELWRIYLGSDIAPKDVAMMMILLKVARSQTGAFKLDNYVDIAGYAACAGEVAGDDHG